MKQRVVITGIGAVTPLGNDFESTWSGLVNGRSGIARIAGFDPSPFSVQIGAEVKRFDPTGLAEPKELKKLDRNSLFALAAAKEAVRHAGLEITDANRDEIGCIVGSCIGGISLVVDNQRVLDERGPNRLSASFLPHMLPDTASGQVAIYLGARGPNLCIVSACATGGHSIGEAFETVRRGDAIAIIAGATDACLVPLVLGAFIQMRALSIDNETPELASRPFDRTRNGFVIGEGAAMLVLETLDHARARGAHIIAEIVGYGSSNDAFHIIQPPEGGEGSVRALKMALRKAQLDPSEVDYVNAHGTSTPLNDKFETVALKEVFGPHAYNLMVSSTKSMTGHMMGGGGVLEAAVCALAVDRGVIPPTINYRYPDPECDLDYVPNEARECRVDVALSNSMGIGGHNACIVLKRYTG